MMLNNLSLLLAKIVISKCAIGYRWGNGRKVEMCICVRQRNNTREDKMEVSRRNSFGEINLRDFLQKMKTDSDLFMLCPLENKVLQYIIPCLTQ